MKSRRYLQTAMMMLSVSLAFTGLRAQDTKPGEKSLPDERWDVNKEYDEQGNLKYYDSTYSRTWKHFDFPEFDAWQPFESLDSLFGDFFYAPFDSFEYHPFSFGPFSDFIDSFDLEFKLDTTFFRQPHGFRPFSDFPDSNWMDFFSPDHLFPDADMPFHPRSFYDPYGFFERHRERMEKFYKEFTIPDDSLHHFHPEWQQLPQKQKNSSQGLEI
jgi:hypothetical protein